MMIKIIPIAIILIFLSFYSWSQISARKKAKALPSDPYSGLRVQVFSLKPETIGIHIPPNQEKAFGVVLDIETGGGVATVVSLATGDASMYTSTSGGVIGGVAHENVKAAAIAFVASSDKYFSKMHIATNTDTPKPGNVKFFILTNKHTYSFEAPESEITNASSQWAPLFYKGNDVTTQLRMISSNAKK